MRRGKLRVLILAASMVLLLPIRVLAEVPPDQISSSYNIMEKWAMRITGSLKNETAIRMSEPKQVTKIRNQFIMSGSGKVSDTMRFKVSGRGWYDTVYDWAHTYPRWVKSNMGTDLEFRDTYLDLSCGPFDARLGKQEVVWGEAVALFYADVVNARDLREFLLPDFDMIRIPQWGIDLEYSHKNFHAEFVWLPDVELDKLGVSNSEFYFYPPMPTPTTPYYLNDAPDVVSTFANGNVGGRLSYLYEGLDASVFFYHTWTKHPVYYRYLSGPTYVFVPEYRRLNITGATFAKTFGGAVFKGEFVFTNNDYFSVNDITDSDGVVQRSTLNYLLGIDYTFFNKLDTNFQFMQNIVFNYANSLINEEAVDNLFAFRIKTGLFNNKLEPEFLIVTDLGKLDMMIRPKVDLTIDKNWKWRTGFDVFCGEWNGFFGQFGKKSRFYSEVTCNF